MRRITKLATIAGAALIAIGAGSATHAEVHVDPLTGGHPPLGRTPDTGWEAWEGAFVHLGSCAQAVIAGVQAGHGGVGALIGPADGRHRPRAPAVTAASLGYWLAKDRRARAAADPERFAAEQAESEEIKRLRRRVAELEVEREILKRSAASWVKESMP